MDNAGNSSREIKAKKVSNGITGDKKKNDRKVERLLFRFRNTTRQKHEEGGQTEIQTKKYGEETTATKNDGTAANGLMRT